ncbi:MAG: SufS family cysteine desulfurase [Chlamydiae bacterium]|nr:SufS family cysteine desulfurase [Chlamydiota bacterium]
MPKLDVKKIRKDFPFFATTDFVYFDSAATTHKPKSVIDALSNFYQKDYATVHRAIYDLSLNATEQYDATRVAVKKFLNAKDESEIIFTRGATDGLNMVALSFGRKFINQNDEIIVTEMEHHSNLVPWQMLALEKKAVLKVIPIDDNADLKLDEFQKLLTNKTKIVCVGHVANSTGTVNPIKEIIKMAHQKGAKVLVDGAQAIAHLPVDVQDLDVDFYAFSSHKMYGPNGVGILYGKYELLDQMPPVQGGGDMIEKVTLQTTTYQKPPLRFEAGTPTIAEVIAFKTAIDYIEALGRENILAYEKELLTYATKKIKEIEGIKIIGQAKEKGAILSFVVDNIHALDVGTLLNTKKIAVRTGHHCAQPTMQRFNISSTTRASFAIYNTLEEVDYFIQSLKEVINRLK